MLAGTCQIEKLPACIEPQKGSRKIVANKIFNFRGNLRVLGGERQRANGYSMYCSKKNMRVIKKRRRISISIFAFSRCNKLFPTTADITTLSCWWKYRLNCLRFYVNETFLLMWNPITLYLFLRKNKLEKYVAWANKLFKWMLFANFPLFALIYEES